MKKVLKSEKRGVAGDISIRIGNKRNQTILHKCADWIKVLPPKDSANILENHLYR